MFVKIFRCLALACFVVSMATASPAQDIRLAPGDALSFWIVGELEPREVLVQPDGTILLPLVGELTVNGLTISQAREKLAARVKDVPIRLTAADGREVRLGLRPNEVGLEAVRFRPIYVSGDVQVVGEVAFAPNLTVRQAIVKAGGLYRIQATSDNFLLSTLNQKVRLQQEAEASLITMQALLAQYGILNEDENWDDDPVLARARDLSASEGLENSALFRTHQRLFEVEQENKDVALEQLTTRARVVDELGKSIEESVEISQASVDRLNGLAERGLLRVDLLDSARQGLLQSQSRALDASSERLRLDLEVLKLEGTSETEQLELKVAILERIREEVLLYDSATAQIANLNWIAGRASESDEPEQDQSVVLSLFRAVDGETKQRTVGFDEVLLPGDVVEVTLR